MSLSKHLKTMKINPFLLQVEQPKIKTFLVQFNLRILKLISYFFTNLQPFNPYQLGNCKFQRWLCTFFCPCNLKVKISIIYPKCTIWLEFGRIELVVMQMMLSQCYMPNFTFTRLQDYFWKNDFLQLIWKYKNKVRIIHITIWVRKPYWLIIAMVTTRTLTKWSTQKLSFLLKNQKKRVRH
jgi:hypothetical protein